MLIFGCLCLNQNHQLLLGIPTINGVTLVYVSSATFIFNYYRLMDSPYSCITNVHVITTTSSSFVSTPLGLIFLDLVFPFRWSTRELIGMFHDLLAFLMECVPFSITSIASSSTSFVHIPLLIFGSTWFNYGVDLLLCGSRVRGRFSLLIAKSTTCKSNMLLHLLQGTINFTIVYLFLVPASSNLVECVLAPTMVCLFLPRKQPKNPKSVINLEILL